VLVCCAADDGSAALGALPGFAQAAAESGNARVVKRWVGSSGRDLDARSSENLTALHYAARGGHNECVRCVARLEPCSVRRDGGGG
jgi:hypothetical protein